MDTRYSNVPGVVQLADGPGQGHNFRVQRAPVFLRVVQDINGKWDILDLLEDEPTREEEIFIYRQESWMHVRANRREDSGVYYTYTHVPIDSSQKASLRYTERWQDWARLQQVANA